MLLKYLLLFVLAILVHNGHVFSDIGTTIVKYPSYSQTILQKNYSVADPNPLGYGPNWIWTNGTSRSVVFQAMFVAYMAGQADLTIKANNSYYAYVNGVSVRNGYRNSPDFTSIMLSCGLNNLTIIAENLDQNSTSGGLIFRIFQNDGYLPTCSNNGRYNYNSCSCQCLGDFSNCTALQRKAVHPICGCKCINQYACNSYGQYFDQTSCSCQCLPVFCRDGFEQDPQTCNCRCAARVCTNGTWNSSQCKCL